MKKNNITQKAQKANRINKIENETCMLLMDIWFFLKKRLTFNYYIKANIFLGGNLFQVAKTRA
jgi:hypothetical protein